MKDVSKLKSLCDAWKEAGAGFAEIVGGALEQGVITPNEFADEFEVAATTVRRWAAGTARPHPILRNRIVASIAARLP